jgi:D-alanyl-D-alanine carboxypeptidase/D-alanyl-D-alanine-endopeptidase (penicillin-binding protein 4)
VTADAAAKGGIGAWFATHRVLWISIASVLAFVLLGTGAVYAGIASASSTAAAPLPVVTSTSEAPAERPQPVTVGAPAPLRTCSIAALATDPRLATFYGWVIQANTGEVLFDRAGTQFQRPASVLKTLTAAAALNVLGPDFRIPTRVFAGPEAGSIVLKGYGDATITRLTSGESFYPGAARLSDLAAQAMAAYNAVPGQVPLTTIYLDSTYWDPNDKWLPEVKRSEQTIGYQSETTALQVDGDRDNPGKSTSPRSTDPIARAGQWFKDVLPDSGSVTTIVQGAAPAGATLLAEAYSQPISALINKALMVSDNTTMEMLARITSKESGNNGTFASLATAIPNGLSVYGIDTAGLVIRDGSGESGLNAVSPKYVSSLMLQVRTRTANLGVIMDGLPVAGKSGSLAARFTGDNAVARGAVFAKTGWIDDGYTLSGIVNAADGTPLTFAFYALGNVKDNAKQALDTITTGAFRCGNNLSNR